jgi:Na+/proline symporter
MAMRGTPIYDLVSGAYQVTLVGAFVPLVMGLYWKPATTQGAMLSVGLGIGTWVAFMPQVTGLGEHFPGQLAGFLAAWVGMFVGSLAPQWFADRKEPVEEPVVHAAA